MFNTFKVGLLLAGLTTLFVAIGSMIGGSTGAMMAFALAVVMNLGSYWFSDKIALAAYRAQPLDANEAPELHAMLQQLSANAGIPVPRLYLIEGTQPNAFATGRNPKHAAVAVTSGLLQTLNPSEVEGVVAHELAHIRNRDTLTMTIAATLAGAIMMLVEMARWGALLGGFGGNSDDEEGGNPMGSLVVIMMLSIFAPIAAMLIQMAISRAREFEADADGARIAGGSRGLMNALLKLERAAEVRPMDASPATAHMFIINPLMGAGNRLMGLFRTHPSTEARVARLQELKD